MKSLLTILIIALASSNSFADNLFKDPEFKKPKDYWHVGKRADYKKVVPSFKKGIFHIAPNFSSSSQYLSVLTPVDLEVGQTYEIKFDLCATGEGDVGLYYGAFGDDEKAKSKKKSTNKYKNEGLGLKEIITDFPAKFTTKAYTFTVLERRRSGDRQRSIRINLGNFAGDFKIKNLSLTKTDQVPTQPAKKKKNEKNKEI